MNYPIVPRLIHRANMMTLFQVGPDKCQTRGRKTLQRIAPKGVERGLLIIAEEWPVWNNCFE